MSETDFLGSITVRMPISMIRKLNSVSGKGGRYRDRSEAIRSLISLGGQVDDMLEIFNDPEKKLEFETKMASLFHDKSLEKTMETMTEKELNAIIFIASNLKDKKLQQLVLDIKKS